MGVRTFPRSSRAHVKAQFGASWRHSRHVRTASARRDRAAFRTASIATRIRLITTALTTYLQDRSRADDHWIRRHDRFHRHRLPGRTALSTPPTQTHSPPAMPRSFCSSIRPFLAILGSSGRSKCSRRKERSSIRVARADRRLDDRIGGRVYDVVIGALSKAWPEKAIGTWSMMWLGVFLSGRHPDTGQCSCRPCSTGWDRRGRAY